MNFKYKKLLESRAKWNGDSGFEADLPDYLFPVQKHLVNWAIKKGRAAIFADCGLGKTIMQLVWADLVTKKTNKPVLLLTPLAVASQTIREAKKFGIEADRSRDGKVSGAKVWVTNYQQLHKFDRHGFGGVACDESSAIKDFKSETKSLVTEFMREIPYRSLWTATPAPNDFWELGTSSEALGYLGFRDMVTMFFKQETTKDDLGWGRTKYRFRGHAETPFWSWVCSWGRCIRKPSDLGFDNAGFDLPELCEHEHVITTKEPMPGYLFTVPAVSLHEQRAERRRSINDRVEMAVRLATDCDGASAIWCELNDEGDLLEKEVPDAVQVKGQMDDGRKEEIFDAFATGQIKRIVTKPKIGCWGLNWQHCSNVIVFPSHSFEQYYQLVRRCWRYGQKSAVDVHLVVSEGGEGVLNNIRRKANQAETMFLEINRHMNDAKHLVKLDKFNQKETLPSWL